MNNIRQIKIILYRLKKDFGQRVNIIIPGSMTQDVMTGVITTNEQSIIVKKAIILDAKISRDFVYDLSFIAANKNFTYGGLFDVSKRTMILDGLDLPKGYVPTLNDRCVFNNTRYQFANPLEPTVYGLGWIINLQSLANQKTENVQVEKMGQATAITQGVTNA